MSDEWRQITKQTVALLPRQGWAGVWDAIVSVVTRSPRRTVPTDVHMSVWVKGPKDVELRLHGSQVETN